MIKKLKKENRGTMTYCKDQKGFTLRDLKYTIWQRDNFKCKYCKTDMRWKWTQNKLYQTFQGKFGKKFKMRDRPTVDHVKPISKGGKTCLSNLVTSCYYCNQKKGSKIY